jgi:hypothetical protein
VSTDYSARVGPDDRRRASDERVAAAGLLLVDVGQVVTHVRRRGEEPRGTHERLGASRIPLMKCTQPSVSLWAAGDWTATGARSC